MGDMYIGESSLGIEVKMYLDIDDKIIPEFSKF